MAPAAKLRYVAAGNCLNVDLASALAFIVNRRLASIVSDSWGGPGDSATVQLAAAEGIGFYFSSGDHGYNAPPQNSQSDQIQVGFPTSDPWVTSVGGTSLAIGKSSE